MILTAPNQLNKNEGLLEISHRFLHHAEYSKFNMVWNPLIDIFEDSNGFKVVLEIPGIETGNLAIKSNSRKLLVRGSKERIPDDLQDASNRLDCGFGIFERAISFPTDLKAEEITSNYNNGLLTIHLPKVNASVPKSIKITFEN